MPFSVSLYKNFALLSGCSDLEITSSASKICSFVAKILVAIFSSDFILKFKLKTHSVILCYSSADLSYRFGSDAR